MSLLRRIIGPDGKLVHKIRPLHLSNYLYEIDKFKVDVTVKFILEISKRPDVGIINQKGIHKYAFNYIGKPSVIIDFDQKFGEEENRILEEFIETQSLFLCALYTTQPGVTHSVLIKKITEEGENKGKFLFVDPHGLPIGHPQSVFTRDQHNHLRVIFLIPEDEDFLYSQCPFQGERGLCVLWSLLIIAHSDSTPEKLFQLINNTCDILGLDRSSNSKDYVLFSIFDLFLKEGFATPEYIATFPPGTYLNGLGRCKKCGGIK